MRYVFRKTQCRFRYEGTLADTSIQEASPTGLAISTCDRGQIHSELYRQGAMRRELLPPYQSARTDVSLDGISDTHVNRSAQFGDCRDPFHTILHHCFECMHS